MRDFEHVLEAIEAHCGRNRGSGKAGEVAVIVGVFLMQKQVETAKDGAYAELVPNMK
jgi:hypothetical protein